MPRSTINQVRTILPKEACLSEAQIQQSIEAACCIVDQISTACASHLSESCLTQVEAYLAAHYAAVMDYGLSISSESDPCSGGNVTYGFKFGEGIKGTPYGQMANTLSGGCLAEFDKQPASFFSIGCH